MLQKFDYRKKMIIPMGMIIFILILFYPIVFEDKTFGFKVPVELTNVSREICNPIESWDNKEEYYKTSLQLAEMFQKNYNKFKNKGLIDYSHYGPKL